MTQHFLDIMVTPAVAAEERRKYGGTFARDPSEPASGPDVLGEDEREFIAARDSFYLGTVSETGWPYIQHRGGPRGFLRVIDERTLAFADVRGNRQLITAGNVSKDPRVALFLMDYPHRTRLKILGRASFFDAEKAPPELVAAVRAPGAKSRVERIVRIEVEAFDWNCQQNITPRFSADELESVVGPLRARIAELEEKLRVKGP